MDLLKLRLISTKKQVGSYYEYDIASPEEVPDIDTVLVKHVGDGEANLHHLDIIILFNDVPVPNDYCQAKFVDVGPNKINAIKRAREATYWGLKESKDFVESFPRELTIKDLTKAGLKALVDGINLAGGTAELKLGSNCNTCEARFRCFTER